MLVQYGRKMTGRRCRPPLRLLANRCYRAGLALDVAQARRDRDDTWLGGHRPEDDRYDARSGNHPRRVAGHRLRDDRTISALRLLAHSVISLCCGIWSLSGPWRISSKPQQSGSIYKGADKLATRVAIRRLRVSPTDDIRITGTRESKSISGFALVVSRR
jgi:hypothetical protein